MYHNNNQLPYVEIQTESLGLCVGRARLAFVVPLSAHTEQLKKERLSVCVMES